MINLSVTGIIRNYHVFDRDFWLSYKTLESLMDPVQFSNIKMNLLKSKKILPNIFSIIDEDEFNLRKELLSEEWKLKNEEALTNGINMHKKLHDMLTSDLQSCKNDYGIPTDIYLVMQTEQFLNSDGLFPEFRIETKLTDDILLVGVADLIIKKGNSIKIIDYKTDEKISKDAHFDLAKNKKKCMKYPLSKIPDCNLSHYQLQLSMYAWMLQQLDSNLDIEDLEIILIRNNKVVKRFYVEYLKNTINNLLLWHIKSFKLKLETNKCKELSYE